MAEQDMKIVAGASWCGFCKKTEADIVESDQHTIVHKSDGGWKAQNTTTGEVSIMVHCDAQDAAQQMLQGEGVSFTAEQVCSNVQGFPTHMQADAGTGELTGHSPGYRPLQQ